jgi:ketosteroid isomerase-like protein
MAQPKKENVPDSPLGKMYEEHIGFIRAHNVQGLLDQYAPDCLMISTMTPDQRPLYVRGHAELQKFFEERIFALNKLEITLAQWAETPDCLMIVENLEAETADGPFSCRFYDNWALRNGKIAIHFAGVVQYPDGKFAGDVITVP